MGQEPLHDVRQPGWEERLGTEEAEGWQEMKKLVTKKGHIAYEATDFETRLLGGCGVCDECNCHAPTGYLVPVLNHYQCPECFEKWSNRATYYPEDTPVEQGTAAYYESVIPATMSEPEGGDKTCEQ